MAGKRDHCPVNFCEAFEDESKERQLPGFVFHHECTAGHQYHRQVPSLNRPAASPEPRVVEAPCTPDCEYYDKGKRPSSGL